jgi:hypothetical protein
VRPVDAAQADLLRAVASAWRTLRDSRGNGGPAAAERGTRTHVAQPRRQGTVRYKLTRYGLTQEQFDRLLEVQGYACAMCHTKFEEDQPIFIDHDHACCPDEKRSCGKCVRGLLDLSCNTALGHIERKGALARAYLDRPPVW